MPNERDKGGYDEVARLERDRIRKQAAQVVVERYRGRLKSEIVIGETGQVSIKRERGGFVPDAVMEDAKTLDITNKDIQDRANWKSDKARGESEGGTPPPLDSYSTESLILEIIENRLAGELMEEEKKLAGK